MMYSTPIGHYIVYYIVYAFPFMQSIGVVVGVSYRLATRRSEGLNMVYFRRPDIVEGSEVEKDKPCTFAIYVDDKGL